MSIQYVIFELANLKYAIEIDYVSEITEEKEITPLPLASETVEGVVNLRGKVIPIINLGKVFGVTDRLGKNGDVPFQIMVINYNQTNVGLIINLAKDVKTFEDRDCMPISEIISNSKGYVQSTINYNNEIIQVISIENILEDCSMEYETPDKLLLEANIQ